MSAREFNAGRCLSLQSDGAEYTVRLKEPIEEQDSFVWLSYELVFRLATDRPDPGSTVRRRLAIARRPNRPPFAARPAVAAGMAEPTVLRRAGGAGKT